MQIFTIGFTRKSASQFFGLLRDAGVERVIDVRLNNSSQLAGFTKRDDLAFFLREICQADYRHETRLAPTQALLDGLKRHGGGWADYERGFLDLMRSRRVEEAVPRELFDVPVALLCSEVAAVYCHRRLVAEYLRQHWGNVEIIHL